MSGTSRSAASLVIAPLAEHPRHLPLLAAWSCQTWGPVTGRSLRGYEARLAGYLSTDALPIALVALVGGAPAGTASVNFDDMSTRPGLSPWLANLYVAPEFRRRGIGAALVRAAEAAARRAGHARLHLYTPDQERLYAGLGWTVLARCRYEGEAVVVMGRDL